MAGKFGFLSNLEFLQTWASSFIAGTNAAVVHNLEKYQILKKVFYLSAIEGIEGDYLEFGVFTGSSLCHSMRCARALAALNPAVLRTRFFGFDSFAGFGDLPADDQHPFYTDLTFSTNLEKVDRRVSRVARGLGYKLVPGFFSDSLKLGASQLGIEKARIIFIDSDTYSSANEALTFCLPALQQGTFIVLDDFYSYRGSERRGVCRAFNEFVEKGKLGTRHVFNYGMGGAVYVVAEIES